MMPSCPRRLASALCGGLLVAAASAQDVKTLDTITVTSTLDDVAERREAGTQKTIVTRQDIEAMGVLTIGDVMGKLPGVDASAQSGDGAMNARARGMTLMRMPLTVWGIFTAAVMALSPFVAQAPRTMAATAWACPMSSTP